jgi:beta-N-acetylglucosaminidase
MRFRSSWLARHRCQIAVPFVTALMLVAQGASAAGDPQSAVNNAHSQLHAAQAQASADDTALAGARAELASANAYLAALDSRISTLDATIHDDAATVARLEAQLGADRAHLSAYLRQAYENGGSTAELFYVISAGSIAQAIDRIVDVDHVANAVENLVGTIQSDARQAAATLADDNHARAQLQVAQQQAATQRAVIAVQEEQLDAADVTAHQSVQQAQRQLTVAQAALAAARASDVVYQPVAGATFTVDTDLTQPSGETAAALDQFLAGTDLAGLGQSFINAEHQYHVNARYFVAHAILESDWGSSAIAQDKHNLFGFNANDSNPYGDATSFPSFTTCIMDVADFISVNYLSPSGPFYHGPTLRGMNVDYASDPDWAYKIAAIANTIPLP